LDFKELLVKQYRSDSGMVRYMTGKLTDDLTEDELNWQARPGHHSIWHHVWHMFLSNDYYSADALQKPPVWEEGRWQERLDLTAMSRAFEYPGNASGGPCPRFLIADVPDELVDELKAIPLQSYLAYVDELHELTLGRLREAPEERLLEKVEMYGLRWPVYGGVGFAHAYRHIGMIEDIRGLIRGPGQGSASI
jgi:DinB superfamily